MKTVYLAVPLMLFLFSVSVVGVEVMAPILTDHRLNSVIPANRLLESWILSVFSLGVFAYNLGKQDRAALSAQGHNP